MKLENWSIQKVTANPYQAPETGVNVLVGSIYNDDRFDDGVKISTSVLKSISLKDMQAILI